MIEKYMYLLHTLQPSSHCIAVQQKNKKTFLVFTDRVEIYKNEILAQNISVSVLAFALDNQGAGFALVTNPGVLKFFDEISDNFQVASSVDLPGVFDQDAACLLSVHGNFWVASFFDGLLHVVSRDGASPSRVVRVKSEISSLCIYGEDKLAYVSHGNLFRGNFLQQKVDEEFSASLVLKADRGILVAVGNSVVHFLAEDFSWPRKTQTLPRGERFSACVVPAKRDSLARVAVLVESEIFLVSLVSKDRVVLTCLGNFLVSFPDPLFALFDENRLLVGNSLLTISDTSVIASQEISALSRAPVTALACSAGAVAAAGPAGVRFLRRGLEASFSYVLEISQNISDLFFADTQLLVSSQAAGTVAVDCVTKTVIGNSFALPVLAAGPGGLCVTRSEISRPGAASLRVASSLACVVGDKIYSAHGLRVSEISSRNFQVLKVHEFHAHVTAIAVGPTGDLAVALFSMETGESEISTRGSSTKLPTGGVMVVSLAVIGNFFLAGLGDGRVFRVGSAGEISDHVVATTAVRILPLDKEACLLLCDRPAIFRASEIVPVNLPALAAGAVAADGTACVADVNGNLYFDLKISRTAHMLVSQFPISSAQVCHWPDLQCFVLGAADGSLSFVDEQRFSASERVQQVAGPVTALAAYGDALFVGTGGSSPAVVSFSRTFERKSKMEISDGPVNALAVLPESGYLVISVLNRLMTVEPLTMTEICAMDFHFSLLYLSPLVGNRLVVGDLLRACSLVQFDVKKRTWTHVARDEESRGLLTAMAAGGEEIFCAFDDGNIAVLEESSPFGQRCLGISASVQYNERVNAFTRLPSAAVAVFGCASGGIGSLIKYPGEHQSLVGLEKATLQELSKSEIRNKSEIDFLRSENFIRADLLLRLGNSDADFFQKVCTRARVSESDARVALAAVASATSLANY